MTSDVLHRRLAAVGPLGACDSVVGSRATEGGSRALHSDGSRSGDDR